jgi:hypothetical protein
MKNGTRPGRLGALQAESREGHPRECGEVCVGHSEGHWPLGKLKGVHCVGCIRHSTLRAPQRLGQTRSGCPSLESRSAAQYECPVYVDSGHRGGTQFSRLPTLAINGQWTTSPYPGRWRASWVGHSRFQCRDCCGRAFARQHLHVGDNQFRRDRPGLFRASAWIA